ncbi:MAG: polysaccharide biosynthesis protein [Balneolaceae bacterium]
MEHRTIVKYALDVTIWWSVTLLAFLLRLDGQLAGFGGVIVITMLALLPVKALLVLLFKTHCQSWRNTSFEDLFELLRMVSVVSFPFFVIAWVVRPDVTIPLSVPILEFLLAVPALGMVRAAVRFYLKYRIKGDRSKHVFKRVLIVGAGESGTMVAREMLKHPTERLLPAAFVDDDLSKRNQRINGIPVAGTTQQIPALVRGLEIDEILIAMPSEPGDVIRRIVSLARESEARYRIIPGIYELLSGKVSISQIRNVDVEDLLRRKPVQLDTDRIEAYIHGRVVMVTGAGGSIGSEIVRQISHFQPLEIILVGRGENSIHQLVREINEEMVDLHYKIRIADVRDHVSMAKIFQEERPEVVFHAAAHKHVPLMEENPAQAVFNNVQGTRNLVNLSVEYGVEYFVNISTDKAVNPTSVMGASKRIAEHIVEWGAAQAKNGEVYVSVRFGNVLGSRGSVIPIFKDQIRRGGPVTVTHPDMIRYFMTIPEAAQLVLQAGGLNRNGAVFVLDMGNPVNIAEMAKDLIRLSGFEPDTDITIEYTGIRPGEKLYEELLTSEEGIESSTHNKIHIARKRVVLPNLAEQLDLLVEVAEQGDSVRIREQIKEIVPTYSWTPVSEPVANSA